MHLPQPCSSFYKYEIALHEYLKTNTRNLILFCFVLFVLILVSVCFQIKQTFVYEAQKWKNFIRLVIIG